MPRIPKSALQRQMGWRLRLAREASNLTQAALAEIAGVTPSAIAGWEDGRNQIDVVALAWIADHTEVPAEFVITGRIGGVPFDIALKLQALQRQYQITPPPRKGPKPRTPAVDDLPDDAPPPRGRTLHAPTTPFLPPPRTHGT